MNEEKNLTAPGIDLDDGKISVPIRNQFGEETGVFRFDPTDIRMVDRYNEVAEQFGSVMQNLDEKKKQGSDPLYLLDKAGDRVIFSKYSGTEVKCDGEEYTIVRVGDILATVE